MEPLKLKQKDKKFLEKLNHYLAQRTHLVLNKRVIHAATLQRIEKLHRLAEKMEVDDSPAMSLCGHKLYAWEFQDLARELRFLLNEL